jgi:hypothetical protein
MLTSIVLNFNCKKFLLFKVIFCACTENSQSNGIEVDKSSTVLNGGGTHSANGDTAVSVTSAGEGDGPAAGAGSKSFRLTSRHRRIAIGLFLTAVGAICWGVATLSAKRALAQPTFRSPLFLVYFASAWKILIFPAYLVARLIHTRDKFSLGHSLRSVNFVFYSPFYKFITLLLCYHDCLL